MAQKDYTQPASHLHRLEQMTRANNSVAAFIQSSDKIKVKPGSMADVRTVFDQYTDFMKNISRGFGVSYERFMQMLEELGHPCTYYVDGVGTMRHEAKDLEVLQAILPVRPYRFNFPNS